MTNITDDFIGKDLTQQKNAAHQTSVIPAAIKQTLKSHSPKKNHSPAKNLVQRLNTMLDFFNQSRIADAKQLALDIVQELPENGLAWKVLGAIYQRQQRKELAEDALQKAVQWLPNDAEAHYNLANFYFDESQFEQAIAHYQHAIQLSPNFAVAHFNLGSLYKSQKNTKLAKLCFKKAHSLEPENITVCLNLASVLAEEHQNEEAIRLLHYVLTVSPDNAAVHFSLALLYQKQEQLTDALTHYEKCITLDQQNIEARNSAALILKILGEFETAENLFKQAIEINPDSSASYNNLGFLYKDIQRTKEAEFCFKKALVLDKDSAPAYSNYALLMLESGKFTEAEIFCLRALEINPDYDCAHINLGLVLINMQRYEEAIEHFEAAIKVNPDHFMAMANLAIPLKKLNRLSVAEEYLKKAIAIKPDYFNAHLNLGSIYQGQGKMVDCIESTLKAIEIQPDSTAAYSNLLFDLSYTDAYSTIFKVDTARQYGQLLTKLAENPYTGWQLQTAGQPLRVGFVSGDFLEHPVSYFLRNVVANIDKTRFDLFAYTTDAREDSATEILKNHLHWHSLVGLNDDEAAEKIHNDGIHILIDLSGHTSGNRLPVFARKPAPVQATWLGYWSTSGVEQIDYLIADKTSLPDAIQNQFTEQIKYIPDTRFCFAPPQLDIQPSALPALKNQHLTLGCYQNFAKVSDEVLQLWAEIFNAIPEAKLRWQAGSFKDQEVVENTLKRLSKAGISADRVRLVGSVARQDYFKTYHDIDFLLDCFPFSGCTTTCEGLWMGVPTLTLPGNSMVSRQGASFMTAVGLPDWVAQDKQDFVEKAKYFATHLTELSTTRASLRAQMMQSLVGDGAAFANNLEQVLIEMWNEKVNLSNVLQHDIETAQAVDPNLNAVIDEVYQLALNHQLNDELVEAEKLYLEILRINPKHPDANHNLGYIENVSKGAEAALHRFEVALTERPDSEQFWVSFIDALNMIGETATAKAAIAQGRKMAISHENAQALMQEMDDALALQNQRLNCFSDAVPVENKHRKFLVVTPAYTAKSAGIVVLHQLCHDLNALGYPTAMVLSDVKDVTYSNNQKYYGPNLNYYAIKDEEELQSFIHEGIVIYPEIVKGNPLSAEKVVRYVLNTEGFVANNKMHESKDDFILSYSPVYHKDPHAFLTKVPYNPIFNAENTLPVLQRTLDVTYVGKGHTYGDCFTVSNSLEITRLYPATKQELALVLRNTRYFYTWDYRSATATDAILCGAIPIFMSPAPFNSFDELDDHDLAKQLRTSYEIEGDKVTVHLPGDYEAVIDTHKKEYMALVQQYDSQLKDVLQKIKKHFDIVSN